LLIFQIGRCDELQNRITEKKRVLAIVESEAHFFEVGLKMLGTEFMPATAQTALEKGEGGFNGVGVSIPANVFFLAMRDLFMRESRPLGDLLIGREFVGEKYFSHIVLEELFEDAASHLLRVKKSQFSVSLANADDWTLLGSGTALSNSFSLAADIRFIHFDLAAEFRLIGLDHCRADSVTEIPSGLIAHSDRALNLTSRHSFFGLAEDCNGDEPFPKREVRVMEDGASRNAKLIMAFVAIVLETIGYRRGLGRAARALWAIRPAQLFQCLPALFIRPATLGQLS